MNVTLEDAALRRFARALTADPTLADDLVQDTWSATLRRPPREDQPVGAWLRTVLRNRWRSARRRKATVSLNEEMGSPTSNVELRDIGRRLQRELRELSADDQEVLRLRFFEGRSAAECGRILGRPASTVRTQTQRSLEKLRLRLDRNGGRDAWVPALAALCAPRPASVAPALSFASVTVGGLVASSLLWIGASMPQGCNVANDTVRPTSSVAVDELQTPPGQAAVGRTPADPAEVKGEAQRAPLPSNPGLPKTRLPRSAFVDGKVVNPKLSVWIAWKGVEDLINECGMDLEDAQLHVEPVSVFYEDGTAATESVDIVYEEGTTAQVRECVEQTILSMQLPETVRLPDQAYPIRFQAKLELYFQGGTLEMRTLRRGPLFQFLSATKDTSALERRLDACRGRGRTTMQLALRFDPITGELEKTTARDDTPAELVTCTAEALKPSIHAVPFEPQDPRDAEVYCDIDITGPLLYTCARLGAKGSYVPPAE